MITLFPINLHAEEKKITDEGELSYVDADGNSKVTTFSAKNKFTYQFSDVLKGIWKASALNSLSGNQRSAERYATELRADYTLSKRSYTGVFTGWKKERYANLEAQYYAGGLYGYKFFLGPKHFLSSEVGLDYVMEDYYDDTATPLVDESATDNNYLRGRIYGEYEFRISEKSKFTQSLEYLHDFDESKNYNINSVTALTTALSDIFSLKTSYELKYDNQPASATTDDTASPSLLVG